MTVLKWEEPQGSHHRITWEPIAAELKAHPGQWALVAEDVSSTVVQSIRQGRYTAFRPQGAFEAKSRENKDQRAGKLYARYVGEDNA